MKMKEESEKVSLKFNIQKNKIMAFSPITSWQIDGETMETVMDFIFSGSKITADGDCSHEIKRHLLLGRKAMTNLDTLLKSRDITLPTKARLVKAMVFPIVMWALDYKESWELKNWCFWAMVLEKTLESLLDCKGIQPVHPKGNQSWIFIGRTYAEAETWILWPLDWKLIGKWVLATHWKRFWCWERLKTRREGNDRGWNGWMASPTGWTWVWVSSRSWWWTGKPDMLQSLGSQRVEHSWVAALNWCLFGEMSVQIFFPLFHWVVCFSGVELYELLLYFGT